MQLVRGLHNLRPQHRGCVATIGNFDGVHRGHQAILARLRERAVELGVPSCVVIFEPQPREYFTPETAPARLARLRDKLQLLAEEGVDRVLRLAFNQRLQSAQVVAPATSTDKVQIGSWVTFANEQDEAQRIQLVGEDQADATVGLINWGSPLGRALLGAQVGDEVLWRRPVGDQLIEILRIEPEG